MHVKRESRVSLRRVLHYNAEALIYDPSEHALLEIVEMVMGLFVLLEPGLWGIPARLDGRDTSTRKLVRHRSALLALLDPTTSVLANNIREVPVVSDPIFSDPPVVREYQIRVPAAGLTVAFRVMDETRRELAWGSRITDAYGELQIAGPLDHGVAVELTAEGVVIVVPIQPATTPPAGRNEPTMTSAATAKPPLANEGWARWRDDTDRLPRVSLMLDAAGLAYREVMLFAERRLGRRWSAGGAVAREWLSRSGEAPANAALIHDVGGELRLYPFAHMGTGFHVGLEAAIGFSDQRQHGTLDVTACGMTLGYKHTFDVGLTFDFLLDYRFVRFVDPTTGGEDSWSPWPRGRASIGWSF